MARLRQLVPEEALRAAYDDGWHDAEIARRVGISLPVVHGWRKRNNLPANAYKNAANDLLFEAYEAGCDDVEIARRVEVSPTTVKNWRRKNNLPEHTTKQPIGLDRAQAYRLYRSGADDESIAQTLGEDLETIRKWRKRSGLLDQDEECELDGFTKRKPLPEDDMRSAYEEGCCDTDIARRTNVSVARVQGWRERNNLPRNVCRRNGWDKALAYRLYRSGADTEEIAEAVGQSPETIKAWKKRSGLPVETYRKKVGAQRDS